MMRQLILAILGLAQLCGTALADTTWVAGNTDVSGEWDAAGSPFMIQGNINVASLDTLTVTPGVEVFFNGPFRLTVEGTLLCMGAASARVLFTADTISNPSSWGGIRLNTPSGRCRFNFTTIERGHSMGSSEFGLGGGLYCDDADVELNDCIVRYCRAISGQGIYCRSGSTLTLNRCLLRDNGSSTGNGGALNARGNSTVTLTDCDLVNNSANYGGAMTLDGSAATLNNCSVRKNDATSQGGGIFCASSTITVTNSTFLANASLGGGAIDGHNGMNLTMDHCLIESNAAMRQGAEGIGGGIYCAGGIQTITNSTFVNNGAGTAGALYASSSTRLENCIVAFQVSGGGVFCPLYGPVIRYNCFANNAEGNVIGALVPPGVGVLSTVNLNGDSCDAYLNLLQDPQFDPESGSGYMLFGESPCINAGNPQSPRDADGSVTDLGAFSYSTLVETSPRAAQPSSYVLNAWPNPFNPSTSLTFELPQSGHASLKIYDVLGREAATLLDAPRAAGRYTMTWQAGTLASGWYVAVLDARGVRTARRLLLLK